jgi:hypothetical protein
MPGPSRRGKAVPGCSCTTISRAPCWSGRVMPSASTRRCSRSPSTITTSPARSRWRAVTRKAESSVRCATCAPASWRPASLSMWTISMPRLRPGASRRGAAKFCPRTTPLFAIRIRGDALQLPPRERANLGQNGSYQSSHSSSIRGR